ncbi:MAG TPA: hypothetical protein VGK72_01005, partial [Chthoniobacterales bacterium]
WLNNLPEVVAILASDFNGKPIREQNLSEWKQRGYRDWQNHQETLEIAKRLGEDAAQWNAEGSIPVADTLTLWLIGRYALASRQLTEVSAREGWRLLREICSDVVELQRGQHSAERLRIERERLKLEEKKTEEQIRLKLPELCSKYSAELSKLSTEERADRIRQIFHVDKRSGNGLSPETLEKIERAAKLL